MRRSLPFLCLFFSAALLQGQPFLDSVPSDDSLREAATEDPPLEDEEPYILIYYDLEPSAAYSILDTNYKIKLHHHDHAYRDHQIFYNTGHTGSPVKDVTLRYRRPLHSYIGYDPWFLYHLSSDEIPFYDLNTAFTRALYSQGTTQQNSLTEFDLATVLDPRVQLSIAYRRINDEGFYRRQYSRHTAIGAGFRYYSANNIYSTYNYFISNATFSEANGGILHDSLLSDAFSDNRFTELVKLPDAEQRYINRSGHSNHFLKVTDQLELQYNISYSSTLFKYTDPGLAADDSLYYTGFITDHRGFRRNDRLRKFKSALAAEYLINMDALDINFIPSVQYYYLDIYLEPESQFRNELFLGGDVEFISEGKFQALLKLRQGFVDADNRYEYSAKGSFNHRNFNIALTLRTAASPAGLAEYRYGNILGEIYDLPVSNRVDRSTSLFLAYKNILQIKASVGEVKNYLFFNSTRTPRIIKEPLQNQNIEADVKIPLYNFLLRINGGINFGDKEILLLPDYYATAGVYYRNEVFKERLKILTGIEGRFFQGATSIGYFPLTAQFHHAGEELPRYHPRLDFYLGFKVTTFDFYFRWSHLNDLWKEDVDYRINNYPLPDWHLRFSLQWYFLR